MKSIVLLCPLSIDFATRYVSAVRHHGMHALIVTTAGAGVDFSTLGELTVLTIESLSQQPDDLIALLKGRTDLAGVVAAGEFAVEASDYVAERLGLERSMLGSPDVLRNKFAMRRAFDEHGVDQPKQWGLANELGQVAEILRGVDSFPVITKPVDMAGSWYVAINHDIDDAIRSAAPIFEYKKSKATGMAFAAACLIEEYFAGSEYSAEVIVQRGEPIGILLNKKYVSALPNFDEIGHLCGVTLPERTMRALQANVSRIIAAAQVNNSVLHVEFKLNADDELAVIEVGCRTAGDQITRLVELKYGVVLEQVMVALKAGIDIAWRPAQADGLFGIRFLFDDNNDDNNGLGRHPGVTVSTRKVALSGHARNTALSPNHLTRRIGFELCEARTELAFDQYVLGGRSAVPARSDRAEVVTNL
jgi:hypothetical protein